MGHMGEQGRGYELNLNKKPQTGDLVNIRFSDHIFHRPDTTTEVENICYDGIMIQGDWISWDHIVYIEVVE